MTFSCNRDCPIVLLSFKNRKRSLEEGHRDRNAAECYAMHAGRYGVTGSQCRSRPQWTEDS